MNWQKIHLFDQNITLCINGWNFSDAELLFSNRATDQNSYDYTYGKTNYANGYADKNFH